MSQHSPFDEHSAAGPPDSDPSSGLGSPTKPEGESPFGPSLQPRLGIIHIMLWTLGSAMILAVYRALVDFANMPEQARVQWYVLQIGYSTVYGAALASVFLFAYRRLAKGAAFPVLPGHWLLLAQGIVFTVSFAGHVAASVIRNRFDSLSPAIYGLGQWSAHSVAVVVVLVAIIRLNDFAYWRVYFWASLVHQAIRSSVCLVGVLPGTWYFVFLLQRWIYAIGATVLVIWLLIVVARDWRRAVRRDWLHWTGVIVTLSGPVLFVIQIVSSMLLDWAS